jgi:hypothetical protein
MAAKRTWKVKVKDQGTFERVQTLSRALQLPEEQVVTEALEMYWQTKESEVKRYVSNLFGQTALFDEQRQAQGAQEQPRDVQEEQGPVREYHGQASNVVPGQQEVQRPDSAPEGGSGSTD